MAQKSAAKQRKTNRRNQPATEELRGPRIDWFKVGILCHELRHGSAFSAACREAELRERTVREWIQKGTEFQEEAKRNPKLHDYVKARDRIQGARGGLREEAWDTLLNVMRTSDRDSARVAAAKVVLDRLEGQAVQRTEVTGANGQPLQVSATIATELPSVEQGKAAIRELAERLQGEA